MGIIGAVTIALLIGILIGKKWKDRQLRKALKGEKNTMSDYIKDKKLIEAIMEVFASNLHETAQDTCDKTIFRYRWPELKIEIALEVKSEDSGVKIERHDLGLTRDPVQFFNKTRKED